MATHENPADKPEVKELTDEATKLVALAGSYKVATPEQYNAAGEELKRIKGARTRLEALRMTMTKPLDAAKKAIMDFFRAPADQLDRAENTLKRAMIGFQQEQERIRLEQQRLADEAARKEREALERRAQKAEASGKVEKAEMLQTQAASVVAPVIQRETPKVAGVTTRKVPKFEIVDPTLVPREYCTPDEKKIRAVVNALRTDATIPGVRVWMEDQLAAGAA
jgi:colicin import membrane protein